jgi:hypothetical protein
MPTTAERQLARLRARFEQQARELAGVGFLLKGSLLQRFKRCSSAGCACQSDPSRLHGPYWQWTSKVNGKTVTRAVSDEQVSRYREWMDNATRFEEIVRQLYEVSAQAGQLLTAQERQLSRPQERARRPRARAKS